LVRFGVFAVRPPAPAARKPHDEDNESQAMSSPRSPYRSQQRPQYNGKQHQYGRPYDRGSRPPGRQDRVDGRRRREPERGPRPPGDGRPPQRSSRQRPGGENGASQPHRRSPGGAGKTRRRY
jgi:hypothetical protein